VLFLFESNDKVIRSLIFRHTVNLCKRQFKQNTENKGKLKSLFMNLFKSSHINIAKRILDILTDLYRKNIWRDTQIAFIFADGLLSKETKINIRSCCFFLNEQIINDTEEEQSNYNILSKKQLKKSFAVERKKKKNFEVQQVGRNSISFNAIDMLPDPYM